MPDVVEPGTLLVARYRLEEHLGGPAVQDDGSAGVTTTGGGQVRGATYWLARDELLDRPVGVCLLRAGSSYADRVLAAARQAAVLTDARFLRILDAAEVDGLVYVVSEWVPARTLVDLLRDGPLPAHEARALVQEVAGALAAAHEAGLVHLALQPEHVLRTPHGQVKLAGLAVDAAARGIRVTDPAEAARADAQGAAGLLYAALTGRWPGDGPTDLPLAPRDGDAWCSPRQVRAGVPDDLDDLVCRVLDVPGRHHGPPVQSVEEMAGELASMTERTSRMPVVVPPPSRTEAGPVPPAYDEDDERPPRSRMALAGWAVAGLVLVVGAVLAVGQLVAGIGPDRPGSAPADGTPSGRPGSAVAPVQVTEATGFDPPPAGNGEENSDRAGLAVDGDPGTTWTTKEYFDPFGPGGLKEGVGLLLDLGTPHELAQVTVALRGGATSLQLRVADTRGDDLDAYRLVDEVSDIDGPVRIRPRERVTGRYVLVWLTEVPAVGKGYRGEVAEVSVRGTA